jgi:hypothetical protein
MIRNIKHPKDGDIISGGIIDIYYPNKRSRKVKKISARGICGRFGTCADEHNQLLTLATCSIKDALKLFKGVIIINSITYWDDVNQTVVVHKK